MIYFFAAELKMDIMREREIKESVERQLTNEQKRRSEYCYYYFFINLTSIK